LVRASLAVALGILTRTGAEASQATPIAVDAGQCTIAPRPTAELRKLSAAGFEDAAAFVRKRAAQEGTPGLGATPAATPAGGATPDAAENEAPAAIEGEPVDAETRAAVEETIQQFAACTNAGDFFALMSTVDDRAAENFLGFGVLAFAQASTGNFDEPPAELDPAILDAFLAARAVAVPPPPAQRFNSLAVEEVTRLEDGRIVATISAAFGANEPRVDFLPLREVDGRYVIHLSGGSTDDEDATPAVATPAP